MADIIKLPGHPLVGTWVAMDDDSNAEFTVALKGKDVVVTGRDQSDGESFLISDVTWNGEALRFMSFMPSTNYRVTHVFRLSPDKRFVEHEYTLTELWKRKSDQQEP